MFDIVSNGSIKQRRQARVPGMTPLVLDVLVRAMKMARRYFLTFFQVLPPSVVTLSTVPSPFVSLTALP